MNAIRRMSIRTLACAMAVLLASLWAEAQTGGTPGKLPKFKSPTTLGDSVIMEDKDGRVGIGTALPASRLTVQGAVEALGGFKFPDGTVQTSSAAGALSKIAHDATLAGDGTAASPLAVAAPLMVRDLDNPARQPFQITASSDSSSPVPITTVPTGKRLVIEFISGLANTATGKSPSPVLLIEEGTTIIFSHRLLLTRVGAASDTIDAHIVSQPFRMYLKAQQTLSLALLTSNETMALSITGYFVDDLP